MVKVEVLTRKGHESYEQLDPEQAKKLIETFMQRGGKYWLVDKETKKLLQQPLNLNQNCQIVLIPVVAGG